MGSNAYDQFWGSVFVFDWFKGCDSYFEVKCINIFLDILFVYHNFIYCQTTRSYSYLFEFTIKKHDFLTNISLIIWYIDFVMTTYNLISHVS